MKTGNIQIDQLAVTGPEKETTFLSFESGLNIIWGSSNAGKSFVRKAIDWVLGGESITLPKEGIGYDNFVLWLTTPLSGQITLRRSVLGGDIYKAQGHVHEIGSKALGYEVLKATHSPVSPNVSKMILTEAGFRAGMKLIANERGKPRIFSLRTLIHYIIVDETRMIAEKSVLLPDHRSAVTSEDRSLIRLLLTGVDASSVEEVKTPDQMKASRDGKVSLIAEMADEVRARIDETLTDEDIKHLLEGAMRERDELSETLDLRQQRMADASNKLREAEDEIRQLKRRSAELQAMVLRFQELARVYASDIERLSGLEEGGFLLQKFAQMNCPVCGSLPEHQAHDHGMADIEAQRLAVAAEMGKISDDATELKASIEIAEAEIAKLELRVAGLEDALGTKRDEREESRSVEMDARRIFLAAAKRVEKLEADGILRERLKALEERRSKLEAQSIASRALSPDLAKHLGLTGLEAKGLDKVILNVLKAWNYPEVETVHYVPTLGDIQVNGMDRKDNGAGVRAVLHSAFKVGVMLYCQDNGRPHPGFLILDAPLMAFTETAEGPNADEQALIDASLATHFYKHLNELKGRAQIIVIENHKDTPAIPKAFPNIRFTGRQDIGRQGFFE